MIRTKGNYFDDTSINPVVLAEHEFRTSPVLLSQSLVDGLLAIKLSSEVDYSIPHHLWLANYLQAGMILLGAEDAVPFLKTDINRCMRIFFNAIELLEENY